MTESIAKNEKSPNFKFLISLLFDKYLGGEDVAVDLGEIVEKFCRQYGFTQDDFDYFERRQSSDDPIIDKISGMRCRSWFDYIENNFINEVRSIINYIKKHRTVDLDKSIYRDKAKIFFVEIFFEAIVKFTEHNFNRWFLSSRPENLLLIIEGELNEY